MIDIDSLKDFSFTRLGDTISPQHCSTEIISLKAKADPESVLVEIKLETYKTYEVDVMQDGQGPMKYSIYYLPPLLSEVPANIVTYCVVEDSTILVFFEKDRI